jgi:hypothetical protein
MPDVPTALAELTALFGPVKVRWMSQNGHELGTRGDPGVPCSVIPRKVKV